MKKLFVITFLTLLLASCSNSFQPANYPVRPKELEDCKIFWLKNDNGGSVLVARCPNSTTSIKYSRGKTQASTITIDGENNE